MEGAAEFRRCLEDCDVAGMRALWAQHSPHLDQPKSDADALASLHMARTQAESLSLKHRAYSHAWLSERGLPSMLPDHLKPAAQQIHPVVALGVGIAVKAASESTKPAAEKIQAAMQAAVLEAAADNRLGDSAHVKERIDAARAKAIDEIFG